MEGLQLIDPISHLNVTVILPGLPFRASDSSAL